MRAFFTLYYISLGASGLRLNNLPSTNHLATISLDDLLPECQSNDETELSRTGLDAQRRIELENPALDGWTECDGSLARQIESQNYEFFFTSQMESETCTAATNLVKPRYDHINQDMEKYREYSGDTIFDSGGNQGDCATIKDLLKAVARGKRVWENNVPDEKKPSIFKPYRCNIPYPNPNDVKTILAKPAFIKMDGDSLTRHMHTGLSLILAGNYYNAGIARGKGWEECVCDGQFSEALSCRALTKFSSNFPSKTCDQDDGPRIVWLQGGCHLNSDPHRTLKEFFLPQIEQFRKKCNKNLTFFVTGLNAQSRVLDSKYKHQSREKAKIFNDVLADAFAQDENIHVADFLNMTMDAQTSDGYHYLTDVNVAKANIFVALVDLISSKQKFS